MNILRRLEQLEEELLPPPTIQVIATIHIVHGRRGEGGSVGTVEGDWIQREPIVIKGEPFVPVDWAPRRRNARRPGMR